MSVVQTDLQGTHLLDMASTSYSITVFIFAVFREGNLLYVGHQVIVTHKASIVKSYVQSLLQVFVKPIVGLNPSAVKRLKDALDQVS